MTININGLNIRYLKEGKGKDILFLHGWGGSIESFLPVINYFKGRYSVISLDLPGFGKSSIPNSVWGSFEYAEFLKNFLEKLNLKKITLVGHSFGGRISIAFASKYPELVDKIVLVNSAGLIPRRGLKYYIRIYTYKFFKLLIKLIFKSKAEEKLENLKNKFGSKDYKEARNMRKILVKVVNEDLSKCLEKIKAPTLLIWGKNDRETPLYLAKKMKKKLHDSGLIIFENAGHFSYLDNFSKFVIILSKFLES